MATKTIEIQNVMVADLAESLSVLDAQIAALQTQRKEVASMLVHAAGGESGTFKAGEKIFTVSAVNSYDQSVMAENLKPGQFQRVSKRVLDTAMVRAAYPHIYAAAKVEKGKKVTMK